jgi:hypothetical protein
MTTGAFAQQDRVSGTEKGSVFFLSKVEIKWQGDVAVPPVLPAALIQDTFISLTNDYPEDVLVQMYFINGDAPTDAVIDQTTGATLERAHTGWNAVDAGITLTMNEPAYWSALTGNPKGVQSFTILDPGGLADPGRPCPADGPGFRCLRGYIVGWAVNSQNNQIRWNHLKAEGTIINYALGYAWEYNSYNYQALDPTAHGAEVGTGGDLLLDGDDYAASFSELLLNFQAAGSTGFSNPGAGFTVVSDTDLTLYPVGVDFTDGATPITTDASILIWNENEHKFSGTHQCITCWDQRRLSQYGTPNSFLRIFLQTDHGKARIVGIPATACNVLDDPATPEDETVTSVASPLLGVHARLLAINSGVPFWNAAAGGNLIGMGVDTTASVHYTPSGAPPPAQEPGTLREILDWVQQPPKQGLNR